MKLRAKTLSAVTLACAMSLSFAADPIKIGVAGPFTGGSSSMGEIGRASCRERVCYAV